MGSEASPTNEYRGFDLSYGCDLSRVSSAMRNAFVQFGLDDETRAFIDDAIERRHGRGVMALHAVLRPFLSDFDINGLLDTYPLFLLSRAQWEELLGDAARGRLLDVGAGNGGVTERFAELFETVTAIETSRPMVRRLRRRGWQSFRIDLAECNVPAAPYDTIALLNVLDRSDRPRALLTRLRDALSPGGVLLIATPLPFRPFVYDGGQTRDPAESLPIVGDDWESAASSLVRDLLGPLGLDLVRATRAPYLSRGDLERGLYVLDDIIAVCQRR